MNIFKKIKEERKRQDKLFGVQDHDFHYWMTILGEEKGEACQALLQKNYKQFQKEVIEVAAVAVAILENFERKMKDKGVMCWQCDDDADSGECEKCRRGLCSRHYVLGEYGAVLCQECKKQDVYESGYEQ